MSDSRVEQLSAMVDGHLSEKECHHLMDESLRDPELRDMWMRYHLIGDALREGLPKRISPEFAKRVALALEKEPAIFVPRRQPISWVKPAVKLAWGWALAASVMGAVVLALHQKMSATGPTPTKTIQQHVELQFAPLPIATVRWNSERSKTPPRLHGYLVNHNQFKAGMDMQGVSPHFRFIGYETSP
jgi:sigma-E factor negative regulatory protein RseA